MTGESRDERLTRIQRTADAGFYGDATDDVEWLLSQVPTEREYRVQTRPMWDDVEGAWEDVSVATRKREQALEWLAPHVAGQRDDPTYEFRVASAPVQVWTPEEGQ